MKKLSFRSSKVIREYFRRKRAIIVRKAVVVSPHGREQLLKDPVVEKRASRREAIDEKMGTLLPEQGRIGNKPIGGLRSLRCAFQRRSGQIVVVDQKQPTNRKRVPPSWLRVAPSFQPQ